MNYRIWYSTESFADYIIANTDLTNKTYVKKKMYESDANNGKNFHAMPDHIKQILYLDAPDLIVEIDKINLPKMNKEEIIFKHFIRAAHNEEGNKVYTFPPGGLYKSMDEYAKMQCMELLKYMREELFIRHKPEEIYELYLKSIEV